MRINQFVARATGQSRRQADDTIAEGKVVVNGEPARLGQQVTEADDVRLGGRQLKLAASRYVLLNKPVGYVCSRKQQGDRPTIYDLLPDDMKTLRPVGRLDADSSGLLLMTNDGQLAFELTHPGHGKEKVYEVTLDKDLAEDDRAKVEAGVEIEDGLSALKLEGSGKQWTVTMREGRNRQIRRTFAALGYEVAALNRTHFADWTLNDLADAQLAEITLR